MDLHILKGSNGKDGPDSRVAHSGGKGVCEIKAWALGVALGNKSGLEALHRAINIPLDLEEPFGTHHLPTRGKLDNFPSAIPTVSLKFLQACLLPLARFRKLLGLLEGSGFSDGSKVGIGSGVEGLIRVSSRVIGLVKVTRLLIFFILIPIILILWRALSRRAVVFIIRGDGRSGISVLPDSWG